MPSETVSLWNGESRWSPPAGYSAVEVDSSVGPGFVRNPDGSFYRPEPVIVPELKTALELMSEQITELSAKLDKQVDDIEYLKSKIKASKFGEI